MEGATAARQRPGRRGDVGDRERRNGGGLFVVAGSQDDTAPHRRESVDDLRRLLVRDPTIAEECDAGTGLEIRRRRPVVHEVCEAAAGIARCGLVEVDHQAPSRCRGETDRGEVMEQRVRGSDRQDPMDHVSSRHVGERTNRSRRLKDLDTIGSVA